MSAETRSTSSEQSVATGDSQDTGDHLRRDLSNRHIQLIAIGGAIGTGLFMGSGKTIHTAGPSIVVAYLVIGIMLFFVMRAMGEVLLFNLNYKSFQDFAADLLGPWAGFFLGWTYWLCWIATGMADLIGVTSYWEYWVGSKGLAVILAVGTLLLLLGLNLLTVKLFGELEFWFALIKLIAISVLIIASVLLVVIGLRAPDGTQASITNLWAHGGFMPSGWSGLFAGFQIAVFAFVGIELVGTTAAETKDPVKTLPKAINAVPVRVLLFYVLALLGIMSVTPWDSVHADSSPFVQMFGLIGFGAAATVMNFVVLTSAASGANSGIYSNSRMLFGLAHKGMAPRTFGRLSRSGVPTWGLVFTVVLVGGSVILTLSSSIMAAFTLVTTVASVLFIFVWSMILVSYLRYRKLHPGAHRESVYPMPGGRGMCWVVLAFFVFVLVLLTQEPDTLAAMELTPVWFAILGAVWAVVRRRARTDDSGTESVQPGK